MQMDTKTTPMPIYDSNNILELRTSECKPFKRIFDTLKENVTDIDLYATQYGIKVITLDVSHTVVIDLDLPAENFDHYYCAPNPKSEHNEHVLSLSVPHMSTVMKTANTSDDVITWIFAKDSEVLNIIITSNSKNEERSYEISLQEPEEEHSNTVLNGIDEYPFVLTMPCTDFQKICRDMKSMGIKYVTITHQGDSLMFQSKSDVAKSSVIRKGARFEDKCDSETNIIFEKVPEEGRIYSDEFKFENLNNFSKCTDIGTKTVKILMNPEAPIIFIFKIGTLGEVTFGLAPKEEDE